MTRDKRTFCPGWWLHPGQKAPPFVPGETTTRDKRTFCPGSWLHPGQKAPPHIFPSSFALLLTLGFSSAPVLLPPPREPSTAAIDVSPPPRATAAAVTPSPPSPARRRPAATGHPSPRRVPKGRARSRPLQHRALITESPCLHCLLLSNVGALMLGHQIGNEASQNYYSVHPESDLHSTTTMTNITF